MITDASGKVTDAFRYDTYGRMTEHVGDSDVIFGYNGRDGVVTDKNGLIYMRARYYSPVLRRFVNADVIAGKISNAITLNRYAYANGNPVSLIDPFGLDAVYVVDYNSDSGVPVVGHALVLIEDAEGNWYEIEYTGSKKSNAKVYVSGNLGNDIDDILTDKRYKNHVYIQGDFAKSYDYALSLKDTNYGGYNLFKNNCLDFIQDVLRHGEAEDEEVQEFIQENNNIVPRFYYNKHKKIAPRK